MDKQKKLLLSSITVAVLTLMNQAAIAQEAAGAAGQPAAPAQDAPAAPAAPGPAADVQKEIQQVVVTGTTSARGARKIDTAFSITTANEEQLRTAAPSSSADVLKIVPGVYAEATGGQSGANIQVRGFPSGSDSPFVSVQLQGNPIYPVPVLSFFEGSSAFRLDDMVERVEVLRGGPSTIYSVGQPGVLMNFILKKGSDTPEGSVRVTTGTGELRRVDAVYAGKLAEGWYASVGGFYRKTQGVRDPQFAADDGHQLTGTLTRRLDDGEVTLYARSTRDKNAFYTGVPLISSNEGRTISEFPGFDPLTGTLMSNEMRHFTIDAAPGRTLQRDLAEGRGMDATLVGAEYEQRFGGWSISNKANYLDGDFNTFAMFTGANPQTAASYLNGAIAGANGNAAVLAAAGRPATGGALRFARGGEAVGADQLVVNAGLWSVEKQLKSFTDELRIGRDLGNGHTLTGGVFYANYKAADQWYLGNSHLMTATPNARLLSATLDNGAVVASANGTDGNVFYALDAAYKGHNTAFYLADEWAVSDRLKFDAGVRRERQSISGNVSNLNSGDTDANPLTLYNNGTAMTNGTYSHRSRSDSSTSYTVGGLYKLSKNASVFFRANTGHTTISFEDLRNAASQAALDDRNIVPVPKVTQYEVGWKTVGQLYSAYINAYYTDFTGIAFQQITTTGILNSVSGSKGKGLEFEVAARPIPNLTLSLTGNWQLSRYRDNPAVEGKLVQRQPKLQFRFSPSYNIAVGEESSVKLYGTYAYIGDRWADQQNLSYLPKYKTLDAGVLFSVGDKWEFRLMGTNLSNELGLTEGNSRLTGAQSSGPINARPIFGRAWELSALYRF